MSELLERPKIKDFFGEETTLQQVCDTYSSQPQLFNYAQALDRYIDEFSKQIWELSAKKVLSDISETFLNKDNQAKAMLNADKVVFQAIGETIKNFPIAECPL